MVKLQRNDLTDEDETLAYLVIWSKELTGQFSASQLNSSELAFRVMHEDDAFSNALFSTISRPKMTIHPATHHEIPSTFDWWHFWTKYNFLERNRFFKILKIGCFRDFGRNNAY